MEIRIRATGAVMLESEFRSVAGASWDQTTVEILNELGADPVLEGPQPDAGRYQVVYRNGVEQINGQWHTKYSLVDMDADAIAAHDARQAQAIRDDRNKRLADCDWTQLADAPVDKAAWAIYRQSLRDITKANGFPWAMIWPETP